jgi:hypothetical protein
MLKSGDTMKDLFFLLSLVMAAVTSGQQAGVEKRSNPMIADMIADPSIQKSGDTWYCYATTEGYGQGLATSGPRWFGLPQILCTGALAVPTCRPSLPD